MGFYTKQPITAKDCSVTYLWTGLRTTGVFVVEVEGDAKNYSYGFTLRRDPNFVGGLKIDSMGWTGPIGTGTTHNRVRGSFPGQFQKQIVLSGSNGDFVVDVKEIPHNEVDDYVKAGAEYAS